MRAYTGCYETFANVPHDHDKTGMLLKVMAFESNGALVVSITAKLSDVGDRVFNELQNETRPKTRLYRSIITILIGTMHTRCPCVFKARVIPLRE